MEKQTVMNRHRDHALALTVTTTCADVPVEQRYNIGSTTEEMDSSDINYQTPRGGLPATVSMDEQDSDNAANADDNADDRHANTMLLKAELLSRTVRSKAIGQLNTPELLRASDEILRRAKGYEGSSSSTTSSTTPEASTPLLLHRANKILNHPKHAATYGDLSEGSSFTSSSARPELSTPLLLQRANKVLNRTNYAAITHGNLSVDTSCKETIDTEPVSNDHPMSSSSVLLTRPPRPPASLRTSSDGATASALVVTAATSSTKQPITPSPKSANQQQQHRIFATHNETTNDDHMVTMEHAFKTLQHVPTSKPPPDSPLIMPPTSVALQTLRSDEYASAGSGLVRSITTTTVKSIIQESQGLLTPATTTAVTVAANDSPSTTSTPLERANLLQSFTNQSKSGSVRSVVEAEDITKETVKVSEAILLQSPSSSLVDYHKLTPRTANTKTTVKSTAQNLSTPATTTAVTVAANDSPTTPSSTSLERANLQSFTNLSKAVSVLSVAEAKDITKESMKTLDETLPPSSLVDDHEVPETADTTTTDISAAQEAQDLSTRAATTTANAAGNVNPSTTSATSADRANLFQSVTNQSKSDCCVLSVAEAKDITKEPVTVLEETLLDSPSSLLVDDHKRPPETADTTTNVKSTAQQGQGLSTPATTTAVTVAANDSPSTTSTPLERANLLQSFTTNQSKSGSVRSVVESEDITKETANVLDETLLQSHSSSPVDDPKLPETADINRDDSTTGAEIMFSPPLSPQQEAMRSSSTSTTAVNSCCCRVM
jgi:hypothetical protein